MADVLFYHLTESTLEDALPGLLERSVDRGWRAVVQTGTEERRDALDQHLWTFTDDSFLAHATDRESYPTEQPILLTTGHDNPNEAQIRFLVDGAVPPELVGYERAVFL
ncbi:MAG: DNA polymerase III subunit chi, partial [Mesorhizobium sp.]